MNIESWIYTDNFSQSFTSEVSGTTGPCTGIRVTLLGKQIVGSHKGNGRVEFSVLVRTSFGSWYTDSGTFLDTYSAADGRK